MVSPQRSHSASVNQLARLKMTKDANTSMLSLPEIGTISNYFS